MLSRDIVLMLSRRIVTEALADCSPPEITLACGRRPDATVGAHALGNPAARSLPAMSVLGGVLLAYLAFFLLTCRAPYSGDEWGPQWLSCARTVRSGASGRCHATHIATLPRRALERAAAREPPPPRRRRTLPRHAHRPARFAPASARAAQPALRL